jgi:hypothetical protein
MNPAPPVLSAIANSMPGFAGITAAPFPALEPVTTGG